MYLIVGLGNPGKEYENTRHNIGFATLDRLADRCGIAFDMLRDKAVCGKGVIEGKKVILVKPQTYMNLSGESVGLLARYYKVEPENVLVLYDDISLDVGFIRVRPKGSAGGHNGIKNLIAHLGTEVFPRVRVGIGNKPSGWDLADYVLGHFSREEQPQLQEAMDMAVDACRTILVTGIDEAMNQYNSHKR